GNDTVGIARLPGTLMAERVAPEPFALAVGIRLLLPDRGAELDLLDHEARGLVGFVPVARADRDDQAEVAGLEPAEAVLDRDPEVLAPFPDRLGGDLAQDALAKRGEGVVGDRGDLPAVVQVAYDAVEEDLRAMGARP